MCAFVIFFISCDNVRVFICSQSSKKMYFKKIIKNLPVWNRWSANKKLYKGLFSFMGWV